MDVWIQSEADVDAAFAEIVRLSAIQAALDAQCDTETTRVREHYASEAICEVGPETVKISNRVLALKGQIEAYCEAHKSELIPNPKKCKTKKFTHGSVSWAEAKKAVIDMPGEEAENVRKGLFNTVITAVISLFQAMTCGITWDRVWNVQLSYNRDSILDLHKTGQLKDADLESLGLKIVGGEDKISVKPAKK